MRFSTSFVVLAAAIGAQAFPQEVQPISQISDGQIQAPPATATPTAGYSVPSAPAATTEVPSASVPTVVVPSESAPVVVPSAVPSANVTVPSAPSYPNGTVPLSSGSGVSSTATASSSSSETAPAPSASGIEGGAATTMVSFAAIAGAVFAYLA